MGLRLFSVVSKQIGCQFGGLTRFAMSWERLSISHSGGVFASSSGPSTILLNTNATFSGRYPGLYLPIRFSSILSESFTLLLFLRSDDVCSTGIGSGSCVTSSVFLAVLRCNRFSTSCFTVFSVSPNSFSFSCLYLLTVVVRDVTERFACVTGTDLGMSLDKADARIALVGKSNLGMSLDKAEARA